MVRTRKIRLINGKASRVTRFGRPAPAKRKARRNPGHLLIVGPINPERSTKKVQRKSKKHKAPRKNPVFVSRKAKGKSGHRRRRNPNTATRLLSRPVTVLKTGAFALGGLVATRQLPQLLLKDKNTGIIGYLANLVTALIVGAGTSRFAGKEAGTAAGIGGALYLANRIISENFSPIPKALALSGIGDAQAVGTMGAVVPAYLPVPVARDSNGNPVIPAAIRAAAREEAAGLMPRATAGMSGRRAA